MRRTTCRACDGHHLEPILDLGSTPLANRLLNESEFTQPEPHFPLELVFCSDCTLLQITETVPPDVLFRDYVYFSSFSDTMLAHAKQLADSLIAAHRLDNNSLVVEAASNDGYLLKNYAARGIPVLGVEPARNIAAVANANGVRTVCEFFGREIATRLRSEGFLSDVFHANNVLAHVADLPGFVAGIAAILKPAGIAVIESPYALDMLEEIEFDTIYHEHLCYYSLTALDRLFTSQGLTIVDVERIEIHGGTLQLTIQPTSTGTIAVSQRVKDLLSHEQRWGIDQLAAYRDFATRVGNLKAELLSLLKRLKAEGKSIAAYGASAKGSTLLNYFGLGRETLDFLVDRSTVKQGKYAPGTHLRIDSPTRLLEDQPDFVLLLTWNFADEILSQQQEYIRRGGRFILPLPVPRIVEPS